MPGYRTATVLIPAEKLDEANQMAQGFDPEGASDNFGGWPLSSDGADPITHYIAGVQMKQETIDAVLAQKPEWAEVFVDTQPLDVMDEKGLKTVEALSEWPG